MVTKKKACRLSKFGRTIYPKNGIFPLLSVYWKNSDKLVQWIEGIVQGVLQLSIRKKTWI